MWSRWDMQETPPRHSHHQLQHAQHHADATLETPIFETTRAWLAADPYRRDESKEPTRRFFLVIDELHAYRGTPGTEVAYILRLLLDRLGLGMESRQLVILATSASINKSDPDSRKFLREFFGRDRFEILEGRQDLPVNNPRLRVNQYQSAFTTFAEKVEPNIYKPMSAPVPEDPANQQAMTNLANDLAYSGPKSMPGGDSAMRCSRRRLRRTMPFGMRAQNTSLRTFGKREVRPTPLPEWTGCCSQMPLGTG